MSNNLDRKMYVGKTVKAIFKNISVYVYEYFVCMHVYVNMYAELVEAREGARYP